MNNAKLVEDYADSQEKIAKQKRLLPSNKDKAAHAGAILEAIRSLRRYGPYQNFIKLVVEPKIKYLSAKLRLTSGEELYRAQGSTTAIEDLIDLNSLEDHWHKELLKYDQRSKQDNNIKT